MEQFTEEPTTNEESAKFQDLEAASILREILSSIVKVTHIAIVVCYFTYWSWKERLKRWLRLGSFALLVLSSAVLLLEIAAHLFGAQNITRFLARVPVADTTKLVFVLSAAVVLAFHYRSEMRKPEYEYDFITRLLTVMSKHKVAPESDLSSLEVFYTMFSRSSVAHVSVYLPEQDELVIKHVVPNENELAYYQKLRVGAICEGVAGLVYRDSRPRYVPRLFLPAKGKHRLYMPHALAFKFSKEQGIGSRFFVRLSEQKLNAFAFVSTDETHLPFASCLSVPVPDPANGTCLAVLNFDFHHPATLDVIDITMATIFGHWLGIEVTQKNPTSTNQPRQ